MIHGKPVVQPGHNGSHLGVLDLILRRDEDGWAVARAEVRADSVSEVVAGLSTDVIRRNAAPLRRAVQADHRAALDWTRRQIGRSTFAMSTCFAAVADVPAMRLLAAAKRAYIRDVLRATPAADLPILALATPYRAGGRGGALNYSDLPAGPLTVRHLFDLYPYPNTIVAHRATGADLAEILERSAAQYLQLRPGGIDQPLIDRPTPALPSLRPSVFPIPSIWRNRPGMTRAAPWSAPRLAGSVIFGWRTVRWTLTHRSYLSPTTIALAALWASPHRHRRTFWSRTTPFAPMPCAASFRRLPLSRPKGWLPRGDGRWHPCRERPCFSIPAPWQPGIWTKLPTCGPSSSG